MCRQFDREVIRVGDQIVWVRGQVRSTGHVAAISLQSLPPDQCHFAGSCSPVEVPAVNCYAVRLDLVTFDIHGRCGDDSRRAIHSTYYHRPDGPTWCRGSEVLIDLTIKLKEKASQ